MEQNAVIQNVISLLHEQKKTQKSLTDYLGITQNAFTDWKSGRIKSYHKHLPKIAEFFGVTVDYLLGNETQDESPSAKANAALSQRIFTEREWNLINAYRTQPPELKAAIDRMLGIDESEDSYVYLAASSEYNCPDCITRISKEQLKMLQNAPETDEDLI